MTPKVKMLSVLLVLQVCWVCLVHGDGFARQHQSTSSHPNLVLTATAPSVSRLPPTVAASPVSGPPAQSVPAIPGLLSPNKQVGEIKRLSEFS